MNTWNDFLFFSYKTLQFFFSATPQPTKKGGARQSLLSPYYVPGDLVTKQLISREQFDRARMLNDLLDRKRLAAFAALHRVFRQTNYDERTFWGTPEFGGELESEVDLT